MKGKPAFPGGCGGYLAIMLLAICVTIASVHFFQYSHSSCETGIGNLGGGFPFLLICDHPGGGSPTSSWGKINYADIENGGVQPLGVFGNLIVYTFLFWLLFVIGRGVLLHGGGRRFS